MSASVVALGPRLLDFSGRPSMTAKRSTHSPRRLSLLWWVLLPNGFVLVVAFLALAVSPISISSSIEGDQLALLFAGLAAMVALNVVLLRRVLAPLFRLTEVMSSVDPDVPGTRLTGVDPRSAEGKALADAFNAMLDRLERARHDAARTGARRPGGRAAAGGPGAARRDRPDADRGDDRGGARGGGRSGPGVAHARAGRRDACTRASRSCAGSRASCGRRRSTTSGSSTRLIALCSRVDLQGDLRVRRELQAGLPALSDETELVVYRVAQESLTNTLRHAEADTATLALAAESGVVTLTISDDGRGLPAQPPPVNAGIAGMRERALLVGGELSIESRPGEGTRVRLSVPAEADAGAR